MSWGLFFCPPAGFTFLHFQQVGRRDAAYRAALVSTSTTGVTVGNVQAWFPASLCHCFEYGVVCYDPGLGGSAPARPTPKVTQPQCQKLKGGTQQTKYLNQDPHLTCQKIKMKQKTIKLEILTDIKQEKKRISSTGVFILWLAHTFEFCLFILDMQLLCKSGSAEILIGLQAQCAI